MPKTSGAIFLGVFRGKISEGISLNDQYCRCVIAMGIPYGNLSDPRVILKRCLLNDKERALKGQGPILFPAGQLWYQRDAIQVLNQALGRVIRHKDDYGVLIMADCRYETT